MHPELRQYVLAAVKGHRPSLQRVLDNFDARLAALEGGGAAPAAGTSYDATDAAAALMAEHRVDPSEVTGTGEDGRILKADVERHIAERGS